MDRLACVDVPALPLQLLLRRNPSWRGHPAGVVDRDRAHGTLLWVNEHARRSRIRPGMRRSAALSLDHELRAALVAEEEIAQAVTEIAHALRFFSAGVEACREEPGIFWLDASGLQRLYPSLQAWAERIVEDLQRRGLRSHVVVGHTRLGTYALARGRAGARAIDGRREEFALARRVPLDRLDLPTEAQETLRKLGIRSLGAFADLPADGLRRRFGVAAQKLHRLAHDDLFAPLQPEVEVEPLRDQVHLEHPENDIDRLLAVLGRHLTPLRQRLLARGQLLRSFTLVLRSEDAPRRVEKLEPAQPTADPTVLLDLARLRLAGQPLRGKVESIGIEVEGSAGTGQQAELFASLAPRDLEAAERALARLRAEFGEDAVLGAGIEEGHLPEARVRWQRFEGLQEPRPRAVHERPLVRRRFDRPRALPNGRRRQDPDGWMILGLEGGAVEEVVGPFVVRGGWWLREVHREYHYVRTVRRGWVWVYYDRRRRRWYQQGTVQ